MLLFPEQTSSHRCSSIHANNCSVDFGLGCQTSCLTQLRSEAWKSCRSGSFQDGDDHLHHLQSLLCFGFTRLGSAAPSVWAVARVSLMPRIAFLHKPQDLLQRFYSIEKGRLIKYRIYYEFSVVLFHFYHSCCNMHVGILLR